MLFHQPAPSWHRSYPVWQLSGPSLSEDQKVSHQHIFHGMECLSWLNMHQLLQAFPHLLGLKIPSEFQDIFSDLVRALFCRYINTMFPIFCYAIIEILEPKYGLSTTGCS